MILKGKKNAFCSIGDEEIVERFQNLKSIDSKTNMSYIV